MRWFGYTVLSMGLTLTTQLHIDINNVNMITMSNNDLLIVSHMYHMNKTEDIEYIRS